eukprot:2535092-Rhodomonas_salina.1
MAWAGADHGRGGGGAGGGDRGVDDPADPHRKQRPDGARRQGLDGGARQAPEQERIRHRHSRRPAPAGRQCARAVAGPGRLADASLVTGAPRVVTSSEGPAPDPRAASCWRAWGRGCSGWRRTTWRRTHSLEWTP